MLLPTALLTLAAPLTGQAGAQAPASLDDVVRSSFGVVHADGGLRAIGPDYKASFEPGGFTFVPALGQRTQENLPVTLSRARAHRGGEAFHADPTAEPTADGLLVSYDHGSFVERYAVDRDGIEQSFLFHSLPAGGGDLVVTLSLDSDLPFALRDGGRAGAEMILPGIGGVTLSPVVGIDADGDTVAGSMRKNGSSVEWVLPADFVDSASLPLVLDPSFNVAGSTNDDLNPDVAYDLEHDTWLAVWTRSFSVGDADVRGRRFTSAGQLLGNVLPIETSNTLSSLSPKVANVPQRDAWVVLWIEPSLLTPYSIKGKSVTIAQGGGAVGPKANVYSPPVFGGSVIDLDLGGEFWETRDDVLAVFEEVGLGIRSVEVQLNADMTLLPLIDRNVALNSGADTFVDPAISKSCGEWGTFLIAFRDADHNSVHARMVSFSGVPLGSEVQLKGPGSPTSNVEVDGNGRDFVAVWEQAEPFANPGDIWGRQAHFDGVGLALGTQNQIKTTAGVDETDPSIGFDGVGVHPGLAVGSARPHGEAGSGRPDRVHGDHLRLDPDSPRHRGGRESLLRRRERDVGLRVRRDGGLRHERRRGLQHPGVLRADRADQHLLHGQGQLVRDHALHQLHGHPERRCHLRLHHQRHERQDRKPSACWCTPRTVARRSPSTAAPCAWRPRSTAASPPPRRAARRCSATRATRST